MRLTELKCWERTDDDYANAAYFFVPVLPLLHAAALLCIVSILTRVDERGGDK